MDRYGAKWLVIVSMMIFGVGIGLISLTQSGGYLLLIVVISYLLIVYGVVHQYPPFLPVVHGGEERRSPRRGASSFWTWRTRYAILLR